MLTQLPRRVAPVRRGLILPLVMVTVAVALILGMCFLTSASTATQQSGAVEQRFRARMIAESGLATALAYVERDHAGWRTARAEGVWVTSQAFDGGTFTITGNDGDQLDPVTGAVVGDGNLADDASDPVTLTSVGTYKGARHVARAVRQAPKARGIVVNERVEVRKTGVIDGYDPASGGYSAATATPTALARSNGLARQPYIRLLNTAQVNGNVYYAPGGSIIRALQKDATATIGGTTTALPAWVTMTDVTEPAWGMDPVGVNRTHASGINEITASGTGEFWYDNVNLSGTATLRAIGNVKLYVRDTLTMTNQARIEVGSPMSYGATVNGTVSLNSSVPLDSYNSALGAYGGANVSSNAMVATNALVPAAVTVSGTVKGDVYTGVGSIPATSIVGFGTVTGTKGALTTPINFPAPATPPTDVPPSVGNLQVKDMTYTMVGVNEVKRITITGAPTSGTFTLTYSGSTTAPIAFNATAAAVKSALEQLGPIGLNNVTCTGGPLPASPVVITFVNALAEQNIPDMTATSSLSGGTAPTVAMATTTQGTNGDIQTGTLEVTGNGILRVVGHRKIRVNGDFLFNGNGIIDIPANASLAIYVAGTITVNGNGAVANTGLSPPRLQIFATGIGQSHLLAGNADLYAIIDAPGGTIRMDGNAQLYGALIAGSLLMNGNAGLHNDRNPALVDANPRLAATWTTGSSLTIFVNKKTVLQQSAKINAGPMNPLLVKINHLGYQSMDVAGTEVKVYAEAVVPQHTLSIGGGAKWFGRIEARDLRVSGTAEITADASGGTARPGIMVDETVEVRDGARLNATGGSALLASHGATDTTIWVKDTAAFKGDGYTAPGGTPSDEIRVAAGATYTGIKAALTLPVPVAALTAPAPSTASVGPKVYAGAALPVQVLTGELVCDSFQVRDNAVLEVEGNARVIVAGDFKMCNNSQLILRPGATLTVYCGGQAYVYSTSQTNATGHPGRLVISCPNAAEIVVRGTTSRLCATILAPQAELRIIDNAEVCGAFAGRRVFIDNTAKFHCAKDLPGPITWLEQR